MNRLLTRLLVAGIAWLGYAAAAHADPSWTYTTQASPLAIAPDVPGGGLILTSQSTPSAVTSGTSGIVATTVLGSVSSGAADHYTNAAYQVGITVTDVASGSSHTFTFNGLFSGDFSSTSGANVAHQLIDPATSVASGTATVAQTFVIGGNNYTVTLDPHIIVGNLGSFPASIGGFIAATGDSGNPGGGGENPGGPSNTPEPSTMVLSMVGLSALGVAALRRRLRQAV